MKKLILLTVLIAGLLACAHGQVLIKSGSYLKITGNTNVVIQDLDLVQDGTISQDLSPIRFSGTDTTTISGDQASLAGISIDKTNAALRLLDSLQLSGNLNFIEGSLDLAGQVVDLGNSGRLVGETEANRIYSSGMDGKVIRQQDFTAALAAADSGNLGLSITTNEVLGLTEITRGHDVQDIFGDDGIERYFEIAPANNTNLDATVRFAYFDAELNSLNESLLILFTSDDNGVSWDPIGVSSINTGANTLEQSGLDDLGRITAGVVECDISLSSLTTNETCVGADGTISLTATCLSCVNGVADLEYSIDGVTFQSSATFVDLATGTYTVTARDQNDVSCATDIIVTVGQDPIAAMPEIVNDDLSADPILLVQPGTLVSISGDFEAGCGTHTITIDWGDDNAANTVTTATVDETNETYSSSYTYTQTGVYIVEITITDDLGNTSTYMAENNVLIYNPVCGSARMAARYTDPTDWKQHYVFTRAAYASANQLTHRSRFTFYSRGHYGQLRFLFKSTDVNALVISGNTATITGQGRYKQPGMPWSATPTHSFTVTFQDVAQSGQTDQIQSLIITDLATGQIEYSLSATVNVWCSRVRVNNVANCRVGEPLGTEGDIVEGPAVEVYPNPFVSSTQVSYELQSESNVRLEIFDMRGRVIRTENMGTLPAGFHRYKWNATTEEGSKVAAGIYVIKVYLGEASFTERVEYRP